MLQKQKLSRFIFNYSIAQGLYCIRFTKYLPEMNRTYERQDSEFTSCFYSWNPENAEWVNQPLSSSDHSIA